MVEVGDNLGTEIDNRPQLSVWRGSLHINLTRDAGKDVGDIYRKAKEAAVHRVKASLRGDTYVVTGAKFTFVPGGTNIG